MPESRVAERESKGLLGRIFSRNKPQELETRSSAVYGIKEIEEYIQKFSGIFGFGSSTGVAVNEHTAMKVSAVYSCVRILAESVAQLPKKVYRETDRGKIEAKDHYLYAKLKEEPNYFQTSFEFFENMMGYLGLRGNAYAYTPRMADGTIIDIIPIPPDYVTPYFRETGNYLNPAEPYYAVSGASRLLTRYDILHVKGLGSDGFVGLSPIQQQAEAIGLSIAAEGRTARAFKNGIGADHALTIPQKLDEEQFKRLQAQIQETYAGENNSGKPLIAESGASWSSLGINNRDAQLLEQRKFQLEEIARAYRVPLHLLQSPDGGTAFTGSGIESLNRGFLEYTLMPWIVRWEQALTIHCLSLPERREGYCIKIDTKAFARADMKTRYDSYRVGLGGGANPGFLSPNDIREKEDLPLLPPEIGDEYYVPLNVKAAGEEPTNEGNADEA